MKKRIVWLVFFVFWLVTMSFAQEDRKGVIVRIKEMKDNAGERWAICIGINDYEDKTIVDLKKARNDAKELGKVLEEYGQFDRVYIMTDDLNPRNENYPKLMNIRRKLDFLKGFIDPEDLVLFSFSGHGIANSEGEGFLVTADSYREDFQGTSLKVKDIIKWLKEVKVKKSLLLLDACREQFQEGKAMNLNGLKAERFLQAEVGAVFYSTKSGWFSYEDKDGNFGVFTRFVIDGLKGQADKSKISGNEDGIITFSELAAYVEEGVSNWALGEGKRQRPYTKILGEKFGELSLSAYIKTGFEEKKEDKIMDDKPADVKAVESRGVPVSKNDKSYWEAHYGDGIIMVYIPEGEFTMGSNDGEDNEKPPHQVYLDGYWIGKTGVTVKQFQEFVKAKSYITQAETDEGSHIWNGNKWEKNKGANWKNPGFEQGENHPVVCVSWNDANAYCQWLSEKTRSKFKLPSEAQREKAARGTDGRRYPWGSHGPYYNGRWYANYGGHDSWEKRGEDGFLYTAPVGSYLRGASPYGLLDMAGNVWEWCRDRYSKNYYMNSPRENPVGPQSGAYRVIRGGDWGINALGLRCAYRYTYPTSFHCIYVGFRLRQDRIIGE